jgi:serine protease Do
MTQQMIQMSLSKPCKSTPPARHSRIMRAGIAMVLGLMLVVPTMLPAAARGPDGIADLAEQVMGAVVNIKASQKVTQRNVPLPQLPPGSPFEDLFNDFFNRRGEGGPGGQQGPAPNRGTSLGSGFVIDAAGMVVTNNHVIADATDVTVVLQDGTELKAEIVGKDAKTDLALLRVKSDKPLKAVKFGDSEKARVGDWVVAIGNPFGFGGSVSTGIVSAKQRNIRSGPYDSFIQTDAAINKGNSGGPLFNMDGDVIGINTAIISPSGGSIGIGFAVPSALAVPIIEQLKEYGETRRAWLGVRIGQIDDERAEALRIGKARGALIEGVDEKSPAREAGLEREDVIIRFDGKEIKTSQDLPRIVAQSAIGKEVDVVVMRDGKEVTKRVKLARLDETPQPASATVPDSSGKPGVAPSTVLGMELAPLNAETRRRFSIKDGVEGLVVLKVDPNGPAGERRLQPGDVIVEVQREAVRNVADLTKRIDALKARGQKRALFYVSASGQDGGLRYVTLPIE